MPDVSADVRSAIETAIPGAAATVMGSEGHFTIDVVSKAFDGKGTLERQRMVLGVLAPFMKGDAAPVHAVDRLVTRTE